MKPNNKTFLRCLLSGLIAIPAITQVNATISTAGNGSLIVSPVDNGNDHIEINGGTTPFVDIRAGVVLDWDLGWSGIELYDWDYDGATNGLFDAPSGNTAPGLTASVTLPATGIVNRGEIYGDVHGMNAYGYTFTLVNTGTIEGYNGSGIYDVWDDSVIVNSGYIYGDDGYGIYGNGTGVTVHNTGTIESWNDGIVLTGDEALIINSGTIQSNIDSGVVFGGYNNVLYNLAGGTIYGSDYGVDASWNYASYGLKLYNWGTITGDNGVAINGSYQDTTEFDEIHLNQGSVINGDIYLNSGDDQLTITADYTDNAYVYGDIYGGDGNDTITVTATDLDPALIPTYANGYVYIGGEINGGYGDDVIDLTANSNSEIYVDGRIYSGPGDDEIYLTATGTNSSIYINGEIQGRGDEDLIELAANDGGNIEVNGDIYGGGFTGDVDTINLTADDGTINVNGSIYGDGTVNWDGENYITLESLGNGEIYIDHDIIGGDGNDEIRLTADGEDSVVGLDYYDNYGDGGIYAGNGDNSVTVEALNDGYVYLNSDIQGGNGYDDIQLTADGDNSEVIVYGGIYTGDGGDDLELDAEYGGYIYVDNNIEGGSGDDHLHLTARYDQDSYINVQSIYGYGGQDNIYVESFDGSYTYVNGDIYGGDGDDYIQLEAIDGGTVYVDGELSLGYDAGNWSEGIEILTDSNGFAYVDQGLNVSGWDWNRPYINLNTNSDDIDGTGAIVVNGGIQGGSDYGTTDLNINGGLITSLFTDASSIDDLAHNYYDDTIGTGAIFITGEVENVNDVIKTDRGLAVIDGDAFTYHTVDAIYVYEGSLYVSGNLEETSGGRTYIEVNGGDEVGGAGSWQADVQLYGGAISAGSMSMNHDFILSNYGSPDLSVGQLDITGSLNFETSASVRYDIIPQGGGQDLITHTTQGGGVVNFVGLNNISLSPSNINQVISDGTYTIIDSDTAITGSPLTSSLSVQFNANVEDTGTYTGSLVPALSDVETSNVLGTNLVSFTTLALQNGNTDLVAIVAHDYAGLLGAANPNMASFGAAIDDAANNNFDSDVQDFVAALDYSDEATAIATAATLSPEIQISKSVALINSNYRAHRMLENHLAGGRNLQGKDKTLRQPVSFGSKVTESLARMSSNSTVWGTVSYDKQDYEDSANNTDYDGNATSFTAGMDWSVTPTLTLGFMLDGTTADYDYSGGSSDNDSIRIAAYGTWGESTGLYSDFAVGYGDHSMDDSRNFGGLLGGGTSSSTDANSLQALWTVGYAIQTGAIKHGVFGGFEYQNMDVDGFNVNNAVIPLTVGDYSVESLRALIGYRAETTYGKFSPYASVAYAHEFQDDDVVVNASLAGSPFSVTTAGPGSAILIGLGTGYSFTESLSGNIGYRGELTVDSQGMDSHGITLGVDWSF